MPTKSTPHTSVNPSKFGPKVGKSKPKTSVKRTAGQKTPPDVLTLDQAAAFLQITVENLRTEALAGHVPGQCIGSEWRFSREGLLAWLVKPQPPRVEKSNRDRILETVGAWKDDFTAEPMIEEIYRDRKRQLVGEE